MIKAAVLTISDSCSQGLHEDLSGAAIENILKENGFEVVDKRIVPDEIDKLSSELIYFADKAKLDVVLTTGGTGFALMALLVGIERGFITREEGITRLSKTLLFLESSDRFHGAWPHWINGTNGSTIPFSEKDNGGDLVETAFLAQGLICVKEYFSDGSATEKELAKKADMLWKGVEWTWYTQNQQTLWPDGVKSPANLTTDHWRQTM